MTATVDQRVDSWKQELLELTNRNPLLSMSRSTTRLATIPLVSPSASGLYDQLTESSRSLTIVGTDPPPSAGQRVAAPAGPSTERSTAGRPEPDGDGSIEVDLVLMHGDSAEGDPSSHLTATDPAGTLPPPVPPLRAGTVRASLPPERTDRIGRTLRTKARASEQEQGINTLFAAFGTLKWREPGIDTWRYAPLLLLPVRIEENVRDGRSQIAATGDDPEFNQTLSERLRRDFRIDLSVDLEGEPAEPAEPGTPLERVLRATRLAVAPMADWEVLDEVNVGTFQFHKLRMFRDLDEHRAVASGHPIVQALADPNRSIAGLPAGVPAPDDLDRAVMPKQTFTVLDADASQLWAVQAAARGSNLIIQGPPGTGKSQTIANVIAECLAAGKTVLFVSEKAAAIEVVHRRLVQRGLGEFCLMLHSQKSSKREVVHDLASRLTEPVAVGGDVRQEDHDLDRLGSVRERLNAYAASLHRRHEPLGWSAWEVHGQLAGLDVTPGLPGLLAATPPVSTLTRTALEHWRTVMAEAAKSAPILAAGADHVWAGFAPRDLGLQGQADLHGVLTGAQTTLGDVARAGAVLAALLGLPAPPDTSAARALRDIAALVPADRTIRADWLDVDQHARATALATEAASRFQAATALREGVLSGYGDAISALATPEVVASYEAGWLGRLFSGAHKRARAAVRAAASDGRQRPVADELVALRGAADLRGHLEWFAVQAPSLRGALGVELLTGTGVPDSAGLVGAQAGLSAAAALIARYRPARVPAPLVEAIGQPGAGARVAVARAALDLVLTRLDTHLATMPRFFEPEALAVRIDRGTVTLDRAPFAAGRDWFELRLAALDDLDDWLRAQRAADAVRAAGLTDALAELSDRDVPTGRWADAVTRTVLRRWLDHAYRQDGTLARFSGLDHQQEIDAFRDLDRRQITVAVDRIRRRLAGRQPGMAVGGNSEQGILLREANKRSRVKPLRWLFGRIPNLVPILKPCLMMSPLSVAQFLPADLYRFDVVVFDEASQVRPHDAIGAIMRGEQLIVAGDRRQLPPTSFFDRSSTESDDEADEGDGLAMESILDALSAKRMPTAPLLWHYRSRHEDLIAFSNHRIYDGQLITFPSPGAERGARAGVHLDYVADGVYEVGGGGPGGSANRVNPVEARRVVALVMAHARERPDESLGVVALGQRHRDTIEEALFAERRAHPELEAFFAEDRPDPFFVKALEQVQGDERDVIVISIGYGRNGKGVLSHNFGPINNDGGERRLNVLVTRARQQIVVVSSIRAGDIDLTRTQKLGPRLLREYLDFAERGPVALEQATRGGDGPFESPFEASVCAALDAAGHSVRRQVGASSYRIDLAVVDPRQPGRYLLGIECDGATYHSSKTARDRDRLRQENLEKLGWRIHRVWSTDWIRNPQRELTRLTDRIAAQLAEPVHAEPVRPITPVQDPTKPSRTTGPQTDTRRVTASFALPPTERPALLPPYRAARLAVQGGEMTAASVVTVSRLVADCVAVEGPIHRDVLNRRVVDAWGHRRLGNRIVAHLDAAVAQAVRAGTIRKQGDFYWPPTAVGMVARGPAADTDPRPISQIAIEELTLGMVAVLSQDLSLSGDDLIVETARAFGYGRTSAEAKARLLESLDNAVRSGAVERTGETYRLPKQ